MWTLRMRTLDNQQVHVPKAGSCPVGPGNSQVARATGAKSARGRVEGDTVRQEVGSDCDIWTLRTGEVCRFSVSKPLEGFEQKRDMV